MQLVFAQQNPHDIKEEVSDERQLLNITVESDTLVNVLPF